MPPTFPPHAGLPPSLHSSKWCVPAWASCGARAGGSRAARPAHRLTSRPPLPPAAGGAGDTLPPPPPPRVLCGACLCSTTLRPASLAPLHAAAHKQPFGLFSSLQDPKPSPQPVPLPPLPPLRLHPRRRCLQAAKAKQPQKAIEIFEAMSAVGMQVGLAAASKGWPCLLLCGACCCRCRVFCAAFTPRPDGPPPCLPCRLQPNTFSYSALISALARAGRWQVGPRRWVGAGARSVGCRRASPPSVHAAGRAWGSGLRLQAAPAAPAARPSVTRPSSLPATAATQEAERYFSDLRALAERQPEMRPNTVTYAALISGERRLSGSAAACLHCPGAATAHGPAGMEERAVWEGCGHGAEAAVQGPTGPPAQRSSQVRGVPCAVVTLSDCCAPLPSPACRAAAPLHLKVGIWGRTGCRGGAEGRVQLTVCRAPLPSPVLTLPAPGQDLGGTGGRGRGFRLPDATAT